MTAGTIFGGSLFVPPFDRVPIPFGEHDISGEPGGKFLQICAHLGSRIACFGFSGGWARPVWPHICPIVVYVIYQECRMGWGHWDNLGCDSLRRRWVSLEASLRLSNAWNSTLFKFRHESHVHWLSKASETFGFTWDVNFDTVWLTAQPWH